VSKSLSRMIYIDDSGHPQSGLAVYGWVEFAPSQWSSVLRMWLDTRKKLWREFRIPVTEELHTTEYVNGRGRISQGIPDRYVHKGNAHWKDFGRDVAHECLETLRCLEGAKVGAVWRQAEPSKFADARLEAYRGLVERFEAELRADESLGIIFMDGDGRDLTYRRLHRELKLAERHVIEDAVHLDSKASQIIQMADLVAWSATAHLDRHPRNKFAWDWYTKYLSERDPGRVPKQI